MASGGETGTREEEKDQAGPSYTSSLTSKRYKSGRKYEGHLYGHRIVERILYYDQSDPRVAEGALEEAERVEQLIITEAASNELKLGRGA